MTNPYEQVDLSSFTLSELGVIGAHAIFRLETENHKPFAVCVFRDHLVRTLMDELEPEDWHLGRLDNFIKFNKGDLTLAVESAEGRRFVRERFCGIAYVSVKREETEAVPA